ncbi:hypothetical protein, partial [Acinetobacter baumannii]|uniref:hypothetical protein n=1 Tax=Acinetobacter baumannii TaxID=470 RepID=UPI003F684AC9
NNLPPRLRGSHSRTLKLLSRKLIAGAGAAALAITISAQSEAQGGPTPTAAPKVAPKARDADSTTPPAASRKPAVPEAAPNPI